MNTLHGIHATRPRAAGVLFLALSLGVLLSTVDAWAQDDNDYADYGRVYLTLDPESESRSLDVEARTPFRFYLVLEAGEIPGFSDPYMFGGLAGQIRSAPELFIQAIDWIGDVAYDFGNGISPGVLDFAVGVGGLTAHPIVNRTPTVVAHFDALFIDEVQNVRIEVGAQDLRGLYDHFAYALSNSDGEDYTVFEAPFDRTTGSIEVNFTTEVPTPSQSWGSVKALFKQ